MMKFEIVEGVASTWFYHLREKDSFPVNQPALCGAHVFSTHNPIDSWGVKTHLNERYCQECESISKLINGALGD